MRPWYRPCDTRFLEPWGIELKKILLFGGVAALAIAGFQHFRNPELMPVSDTVDFQSLRAMRSHLATLKHNAKVQGLHGEAAGTDYYESYLHFLEDRVNPGADEIDMGAYERSLEHKKQMPAADAPTGRRGGPLVVKGFWQPVGPYNMDVPYRTYYGVRPIAGRLNALAYHPTNANIIYAGAGNGGVLKSVDGGATWSSATTDTWDYLPVSSLAIDPNNPNVVYAGTGDHHGGVPYGMGIMKSTDAGATWTNYGRSDFGGNAVSRIIIDPANSSRVVITCGRGASGGGNIWYSTNAGVTWNLSNAPSGDWRGMSVSTSNGGVYTYYAVGANGIYKSTNGSTWQTVTAPFGSSYDVACSRRTSGNGPQTLYVLVPASDKIWRSVNGGSTWVDVTTGFPNGSNAYNWSQDTYDFWIGTTANGSNDNVFVGLITVASSPDSGATWADIGKTYTGSAITHNDQHCYAPHPTDPNQILTGGDGGAWKVAYSPSTNTATFTGISAKMQIAMFYAMAAHPTDSTRLLGGTQDNASPNSNGDLNNWNCRYAGDGGYCAISQTNPLIQYSTSQSLNVYRTSNEWSSFSDITPTKTGESAAFIAPIALANNQTDLYALSNRFRVRTGGAWNAAGTGQLIASSGTGRSIGICPSDSSRVYTGASNGEMWMTTNAPTATSWTQINGGSPSLPTRNIRDISPSPTNANDVLVAVTGTGTGHLWRCVNTQAGTRVWTDVSGSGVTGLPDVPATAIARDPWDAANTWYVATDLGVFKTTNAGSTWLNMTEPLRLPNVRVYDLEASPTTGYLYAATYGRGMWRILLKQLGAFALTIPNTSGYGGRTFTSTAYITGYAPHTGATVNVSSSNPSALTVPSTVFVPAESDRVVFNITTNAVSVDTPVTVTITLNGISASDTYTVLTPTVSAVTTTPTYIAGGQSATGRVTLIAKAPAGGKIVTLSDNSGFVTTPASVAVSANATLAQFNMTSTPVTATQTVTITATTGAVSKTATLLVYQLLLSDFSVVPGTVTGGSIAQGTVTITNAAPVAGANVLISSNNLAASVPGTVTVGAGQTSKLFTVTTSTVVSSQSVTLTAKRGPVTITRTLVVSP